MAVELVPAQGKPAGRVATLGRPLLERARTLMRSYLQPIQGPYTSILVTDDAGAYQWLPVTQQTALSIGAVYAALGVYADLIGTLPVRRYRGEFERLPLPPFIEHPAGMPVGWTDEIGQVIWSLLLRGNAYLIPTSVDSTLYPASFYVADPDAMAVKTLSGGALEYRYRATRGIDSDADRIWRDPEADELLHLRWQRPPGAVLGVGILDAQGAPGGTLAGVWHTERYAADVMANPVPPAVLEHPLRLNAQQAADLQMQWSASVGRARAVPAVLSGGIKYQPLTVSARDVQLIESRRWNATTIATLFRLPAYMLGGSTGDSMTYSTVEGENTRLWTNALQPMAVRLERGIGGAWTPLGQRLRFVPDSILRSQTLDRFQAHKIALEAEFETVDEVRALENLAPLASTVAPGPMAEPASSPAEPAPAEVSPL